MIIKVNYKANDGDSNVYSVTQQEFLDEVKEYARRMFRDWTLTKDKLPEEGKWVFGRQNRGTWRDKEDDENRNVVVVKLKKGLSLLEKYLMKKGELPDPEGRSAIFEFGDELAGLNLVPYAWKGQWVNDYYGQEIYCWMPIPMDPVLEPGASFTFNCEIDRFRSGAPCCPNCGEIVTLDVVEKTINDPEIFKYVQYPPGTRTGHSSYYAVKSPSGLDCFEIRFTCEKCSSKFISIISNVLNPPSSLRIINKLCSQ